MRKSVVWPSAVLAGLMLAGLGVGRLLDSSQDGATSRPAPGEDPSASRTEQSANQFLPGLGDYELFPFPDFLGISEGVFEGDVIGVSDPEWNLHEGEKYDHHKDYPWDPLTFRTVTIRVDRWLYNDGSFAGSELVLTLSGGRIEQVLTREEIVDLADLEHHPEIDPYEVVPGGIVSSGEDPVGGLTFSVGERVAVLVNRTNFSTPNGVIQVPQVTGHGEGKFLIGANGELQTEVVSQPDAPKSLTELEELVRRVKGTS